MRSQRAKPLLRTIQAHLSAIKAFTGWLVEGGKLPRDPLATVKKPNFHTDLRRERRMLLPDEWSRLHMATESGPQREGMSGRERALLYSTAIQIGLRSNELRSLTRASVVLKATRPFVYVKAADAKNSKTAQQFIDGGLAVALRDHVTAKLPAAKLFNLPHESYLARMLRADLQAAHSDWLQEAKCNPEELTRRQQSDFLSALNHDGRSLDFHSLRHTCSPSCDTRRSR